MSKEQNRGKTKEWRKPEYKLIDGEKTLVPQRRFVRRKAKNKEIRTVSTFPSTLLIKMMQKIGLMGTV
jgi:hypothetical protein